MRIYSSFNRCFSLAKFLVGTYTLHFSEYRCCFSQATSRPSICIPLNGFLCSICSDRSSDGYRVSGRDTCSSRLYRWLYHGFPIFSIFNEYPQEVLLKLRNREFNNLMLVDFVLFLLLKLIAIPKTLS